MVPDFLLVSDQIGLSAFRESDKSDLIHWLQDDIIQRHTLHIPFPYGENEAEHWLEHTRKMEEQFDCRPNWAIRNAEGRLIGGIGRAMHQGDKNHWDEIGYWLAEPYRGKGVMTSTVDFFCKYWFEHSPLVRIEAAVFDINPASARVLEKAGFEFEGRLRKKYFKNGQFVDGLMYGRLK